MTQTQLLKITQNYNVRGINFGGCIEGQSKGFKGAMRRSAHAHIYLSKRLQEKYPESVKWMGWICVKSSKVDKLLKANGQPNQLFWHEVSHIFKRSRSQKECDTWAWQQTRNF